MHADVSEHSRRETRGIAQYPRVIHPSAAGRPRIGMATGLRVRQRTNGNRIDLPDKGPRSVGGDTC